MRYADMSPDALRDEYSRCLAHYEAYRARGLALNMSRGKPDKEQLALSNGMLNILTPEDCFAEDGTDCRNYGGNDGLPEMKRLFAEILDVRSEDVIVGGNSSLALMFDCAAALCATLWRENADTCGGSPRFLCPVPGYDRHFTICEYLGIEMIPVDMTETGPDMDTVERLAAGDARIVGMWCVPVFSNPQGIIYSDETIRRLAAMPAAHPHFRIFWDNAYTVHHFRGERPRPLCILQECARTGYADRPLVFTSFSKISFAGAAVAAMAASSGNTAFFRKRIAVQTVGPDKLNQLRHVRFFQNLSGVLTHMDKLAALMRPKFDTAQAVLSMRLGDTGAAEWRIPDGGYFLSVDTQPGCAKRAVALCHDAGVELTAAGATYPYKKDPLDRNIRLAPSYVSSADLAMALEVFCEALKLAVLERLLGTGGASDA